MFNETPIVVCDMFLRYMTARQSRTYYWIRAKDVDGNGRVVVTKDELCEFFQINEEQLRKLFAPTNTLHKLLFRAVIWKEKTITIYLKSQYDIANTLKIKSFKDCAFTEVLLKDVLHSPKALATEVSVKYHQHKTHHAIKHDDVNYDTSNVLPLNFSSTSYIAGGVTEHSFNNNKPNAIVIKEKRDDVISYGTSHQTIANKLGVSVSTVKRHLKNVDKVKCYKEVKQEEVFINKELKTNKYFFFFTRINSFVKPLPNIYINNLIFNSKRYFKNNYNNYLQQKQVAVAS